MIRKRYPKLVFNTTPVLFEDGSIEVALANRRGDSVWLCNPRDLDLLESIKAGRLTIPRARVIVAERTEAAAQWVEYPS